MRSALNPHPLVVSAARALLGRVDELADGVSVLIEKEEPAYGDGDLVSRADLRATNRHNMVAILSQLAGVKGPGLAAPGETGRKRAEQRMPLAAVLRAYRIGTGYVWGKLIEVAGQDPDAAQALLELATDVWGLVDDYSQALTAAYQDAVTEQMRRDARARDAALDALLAGDLLEGARLFDCAAMLRLPHHGTFTVVCAAASPAEEAVPGVEGALAWRGVRSAWRVERDAHVGVVSLTERVPLDDLCSYLRTHTTAPVGVSAAYSSLDGTHQAARQARLAVAAAPEGSCEVIRYDQASIPILLASAPDAAAELVQAVLGAVLQLPGRDREVLLGTVDAWFAAKGEPSAAGERLHCHRNTVRYRLNRFTELTGRNLAQPAEAAEIYLAMQAHRIGPGGRR
ncbi:helix-turn-helix domain-containing protein [Haloechinothrix halophila]|uniref:helix-turn-helix domain-containing protein n=1 Tax=Haloechinothrix halophila TaxID=1069073 RepID=UPI0003FA458F|nr:helix-turn-helix domain-containing protein [Haloechinothrix halophila]